MSGIATAAVEQAASRIAELVRPTRLARADALSQLSGANAYLKLENTQETGSFKLRGAANAVLRARERGHDATAGGALRGLVAVSTGNHGRAVAYVGRALGLSTTVFVSRHVPEDKLEALRDLGADLQVAGDSQDEAEERAVAAATRQGWHLVHPFDDEDVIAGQGTVGLELGKQAAESSVVFDVVLVPLSGGGLFSGVALGLAAAGSRARLVAVAMRGGSAMAASLAAGKPTPVAEVATLADSLQGGLGLDNRLTFDLVSEHLDDLILLDEGAIARGMVFAYQREGQLLEGAGAVGVAAILDAPERFAGQSVGVIASGGNVPLQKVLDLAATP